MAASLSLSLSLSVRELYYISNKKWEDKADA